MTFRDDYGYEIYIESRYSKKYRITADELRILRDHVLDLAVRVRQASADKLASFCGLDAVDSLPEPPSSADVGNLPDPPSLDDPAAFEAWRQSLVDLGYERGMTEGESRGKQAGIAEGETRGKEAGITEGLARALLTVLSAREIPVDPEARARIEACQDAALLQAWIGRAAGAASTAELFAPS